MSDKRDNQTVDQERPVDEHRLSEVRVIIRSLAKYIHGKKLYAKNNPNLVKFAKEFDAALQTFFAHQDELVLTIEKHEIKWLDKTVYESDQREESIAFLLYKDGIGELSMQSSVTFGELERFVDIVKSEIHNFKQGQDIVTQLWKADFDAISYRVLDEYLVGQFGEGRPEDGEQSPLESEDHWDLPSFEDKGRVIVHAKDKGLQSIRTYLDGLVEQNVPDGTPEEKEAFFQEMAGSLFRVSSEERRQYHEELAREREVDGLVEFIKVIVDFAATSENPTIVRDTSNVLESVVEYLITESDPTPLTATLETIREAAVRETSHEKFRPALADIESRLTDTQLLNSLDAGMRGGIWEPEDVFGYYVIVGKKAIDVICVMLEKLEATRLHRLACNALLEIAGEDIAGVMDKLSIDVPHVAQDIVYLIEKSGGERLPELVEELMYYPDVKVREAVIGYLVKANTDDTAALLTRLLGDTDKQIRVKTLASIADIRHSLLTQKLIELAFDKELSRRTFDEQELIFRIVGAHAGEAILPEIENMAKKKNLLMFGKQNAKQNKILAVCALQGIGTTRAAEMLETLASDQNDLVKSRARRALDVLVHNQGSPR